MKKSIIKEYSDVISKKRLSLLEKKSKDEMEVEAKRNKKFDSFEDKLRLDEFLRAVCSLLNDDHTKVTIGVQGKFIIPTDDYKGGDSLSSYKGDSRINEDYGYRLVNKPSLLKSLFSKSISSKLDKQISLIEFDGELYRELSTGLKSELPLYLVEKDQYFEKYKNKVMKFPIGEYIQMDERSDIGTKFILGDEEITFIISNAKDKIIYNTKISYNELGLVLEHHYNEMWSVANSNIKIFRWTRAILVKDTRVANKITLIDYLTEVINSINLDFSVAKSNITRLDCDYLPLYEIKLKP